MKLLNLQRSATPAGSVRLWLIIGTACLLVVAAVSVAVIRQNENTGLLNAALAGGFENLHKHFQPQQVLARQPPITNAPTAAAAAKGLPIAENDLVVGVVVNGEARAYPINMLTGPKREIINDTLAGRPIAATW